MTDLEYVDLLVEEIAIVTIPDARRRRSGPHALFADCLGYVRRDLGWLQETLHAGGDVALDVLVTGAGFASETTSLLYAAGASHPAWRHWSALTALGRLLHGDLLDGCIDAVLGAEWAYVERLGTHQIPEGPSSQRVVWQLTAGGRDAAAGLNVKDDLDRAWLTLLESVPARDHRRTDAALGELAEFWMGEDEGWEDFHPRQYPLFQPDVCAAAQAAVRRGYVPQHLDERTVRYLDPGLATDEPAPLSPAISPFA